MSADGLFLGVDLGGTKVEAGLVDAQGRVLVSHRYPTHPDQGPDAVIADVRECVGRCLAQAGRPAAAIGVGIAGQVTADGVVRLAPNLRWQHVPLRAKLEATLRLPVFLTNDVRAAAVGEWRYGAGVGADDIVCIFVGTGIGGGVITGGRVLRGAGNAAGEIGHSVLVAGGRRCRCGNRGCLEAYAGGWAIAERAQEAVRSDLKGGAALLGLTRAAAPISAADVADAFRRGDPLAGRLIGETVEFLTAGVVGIVNVFNPAVLILGGGVVEGLPEWVDEIAREVRARALPAAAETVRVTKAALGGRAGMIGAAALAREVLAAGGAP